MSADYVSILMPSKNVERYIEQCIDSILAQTHKNYEFIILDDSEDNTPKLIDSYSDKRIKHIKFKGNVSQKLNYGISIARYNYICRMDGDDIVVPERIEKQLNYIKLNTEIDILGTNYYSIDKDGKVVYEKKLPESHEDIEFIMPIFTSVIHGTILTKKNVLTEIGGYNENIILVEDAELFLRCLNRYKFHNLQEPLYYYRIGHKAIAQHYNRLGQKACMLLSNKISYKFGHDYLKCKAYENNNLPTTMFQIGLLEYYKNDVEMARRYFFSLLKYKEIRSLNLYRYLILSLLGNRLLKYFRNIGLLNKLNIYLINLVHWDSNKIK